MKTTSIFLLFIFCTFFSLQAQYTNTLVTDARKMMMDEDFVNAIENLNDAIHLNQFDYEAYFLRGISKFSLGDIEGAENDYTASLDLFPYSADAFHYRALARDRLYNFDGALRDFARALKLAPKRPEIYLNRAITHLFIQEFELSIADCDEVININKKDDNAYVIRGSAKGELEQYESAIEDFGKAIEINPKNVNAHLQRGVAFMDTSMYDEALLDFNTAIELDADSALPLYYRALVNIELENFNAASKDLNNVIEMSPYNAPAYFNRAILKSKTGKKRAAIKDIDKVIEIKPKNIVAYFNRSSLNYELGDLKAALVDINHAIEVYPEFGDAYYNRSIIKHQLKDWEGAEKDLAIANGINEYNSYKSDSLKTIEGKELRKLIDLGGDFGGRAKEKKEIQYQHVNIDLKSPYYVTWVKDSSQNFKLYDAYGKKNHLMPVVIITNTDARLPDDSALIRIAELSRHTNHDPVACFKQGTIEAVIQNFSDSFEHFDKAIELDSTFALAYFQRANAWLSLLELINSFNDYDREMTMGESDEILYQGMEINIDERYNAVVMDYNKTIELDADFPYAYYNRAWVRGVYNDYSGAATDFSKAASRAKFPEANYNQGITLIYLDNRKEGCRALSSAGELGMKEAYNVMKRYCNN